MRHFTTEHTVYKFDELSDDAKAVALESARDAENEMGFDFLSESMKYELTEHLLPKYKMTCDDAKTFYSLGYSQGDGAMFEGTIYWKSWRVEVKQSGHYYHYNSKTFWNDGSITTGKPMPSATAVKFNEEYVSLCQELEKYGYAEIEYQLSDEALTENIEANEYEFYADGKQA